MRIRDFIKARRAYLLGLCALVMSSCGLVVVCVETPKTMRQAEKLTQYTPLSVEDLATLLKQDTTHYKFVVFFSYCCGPCHSHMASTYPDAMKRYAQDSVKWYYVAATTAQLERAEQMLQGYNISESLYYLRETSEPFKSDNEEKWNNIANHIFTNGGKVTGNVGIPCNFIVSPDGKVKKCFFEGTNNISKLCTQDIYFLDGKLQDIDFDRQDTIRFDYPMFEE